VELDMKSEHDQIGGAEEATLAETFLRSLGPDFRWELAFPELTEDMVERLRAYGSQETFHHKYEAVQPWRLLDRHVCCA
jgi:hypothetical protein